MDTDPVRGKLKELDLAEPDLKYQALSYTWIRPESSSASGNWHHDPPSQTTLITKVSNRAPYAWEDQPKPHHVIIEDTRLLPITCNLLSALTRVRSPNADVVLFVDALSIDQGTSDASLKDRSQQIKLMRNIFRGAERVLADLGDYEDGAVDCLDTIQCLAGVDSEVWNAYEANPQGMMPGCTQDAVSTRAFWQSFIALCKRSWWRRLWILQEILLAPAADFYINEQTLSRSTMLEGLWRLWAYVTSSEIFKSSLIEELLPPVFRECEHACMSIKNLNNYLSRYPESSGDGLPIVDILAMTSLFRTTVPHDQLFALLGFAKPQDRKNIVVDYALPYSEVLIRYSRYLVSTGFLNELLHLVTWDKPDSLPSWVLDPLHKSVHDILDQTSYQRNNQTDFQAGGHEHTSTFLDPGGTQLFIKFVAVGQITTLTDPCLGLSTAAAAYWEGFGRWYEEARNIYINHHCNEFAHDANEEALMEDFWSVLTADRRPLMNEARTPKRGPDESSADIFYSYATIICSGRCFAILSSGRYCLVPRTAKLGDYVVVLFGVSMPFVVREQKSAHLEDNCCTNTYTLVGSAYVHGIMDGELIQDDVDEQAEKIRLV